MKLSNMHNPINLFLIDMSHADNTSGVDRHISMLLKGLKAYPFIRVHWIHLLHGGEILFYREEYHESYTKMTIPLPQQFNEIIVERFWIRQYNEQVFRLTEHLFKGKKNCILHLHTLNLIDLAVFIREQIPCKIIMHLHCIPWKEYYNSNKRKFNELYRQVYVNEESEINSADFITNNCELQSYTDADHIVSGTRCAVDFLGKVMKKSDENVSVIPNGIGCGLDPQSPQITHNLQSHASNGNGEITGQARNDAGEFKLLYVGVLSKSKGLDYILKAMRKVKLQGYNLSLTVAGTATPPLVKKLKDENHDLSLHFLGRVPFDELKKHYCESDAGIIASLQEQSSYVGVEMAMFGLPVITTAVDGLDEIFTDNVNALKVNTRFSGVFGLSADVDMMAEKIISLVTDKELRAKLSKNARALYEKELTLQRMMQQTINVYQKVIGESTK